MIPIYRAKKKNGSGYITGNYIDVEFSNEEYVDIEETEEIIKHCIIKNSRTLHDDFEYCNFEIEEIDISTLSIHFPDMLDSQGNKIFASLQEDGKGGDMFILGDIRLKYIAMIRNNQLMAKQEGTYGSFIGQGYATVDKWKLIGIKE